MLEAMTHAAQVLNPQHLQRDRDDFAAACLDPVAARERLVTALVENGRESAFGRAHGVADVTGCADWQSTIPVGDYATHAPWIARIAAGERTVLTTGDVLSLSPTSGSSGGQKLIPFTRTFATAMGRSIGVWLATLCTSHPEAMKGRAYWSISPPLLGATTTSSVVPVQLPADADYVSPEIAADLANWLVVPPLLEDRDAFFAATVDRLLACRDLAMISVWSPSSLLVLDDALRRTGRVGEATWSEIWPALRLCSCWTHGEAARWLPAVRRLLGDVPIQGKGLMATEGITSIPIAGGDPVHALTGQLVELRADGLTIWPDQAELDGEYEVILSTQAGLYRYATGDRVRVTGWYAPGVPRLRFLGRGDAWSDRVGEKLSAAFVADALAACHGADWCVLVAGDRQYTLVVAGDANLQTSRDRVNTTLRRNPYYAQACDTGQLLPLAVVQIPPSTLGEIMRHMAERQGCREGDVKLRALVTDPDAFRAAGIDV